MPRPRRPDGWHSNGDYGPGPKSGPQLMEASYG